MLDIDEIRAKFMQKNSVFQEIFITVVSLTLLSGGVSLHLSSQAPLALEQNRVFEMASNTWQTGIGAVFGLLGAKAIIPSPQKDEEEEDSEDKK
jgi:hypothetical protein